MKTVISISTLVLAMALAGCQITVDDDRVSGSLGSGDQQASDKARPGTDTNTDDSTDEGDSGGNTNTGGNTGVVIVDGSDAVDQTPTVPEPEPTQPEPTEPEPTEPEPTEPEPTEPEPTQPVPRSVTLYWSTPLERVNGEALAVTDIAGYEIRYRKVGTPNFTKVIVNGHAVNNYYIDDLTGDDYVFEVAVFDTSGLYSDFVVAQ